MMYQRDMDRWSFVSSGALADQAEQEADDRTEERIDRKEKEREQRRHDEDHDPGANRLIPRRPNDLRRFGAHLPDEFAWGGLRHLSAHLRIEKGSADQEGPAELNAT